MSLGRRCYLGGLLLTLTGQLFPRPDGLLQEACSVICSITRVELRAVVTRLHIAWKKGY
ncbi:hypothetical protein LINGRAHAP2_LOCUS33866 [Linum grandiflorum]